MTFSLIRFLREPADAAPALCELCALPLREEYRHGHLVDTVDRRLMCICHACSLLFNASPGGGSRFKVTPERYARIPSPVFSDAEWEALGIPIGLAFFFENGESGQLSGFYPSAAGATECLLPLDAWQEIQRREPLTATMQPDVEGVLVYRPRDGEARAYLVPINACYELVGLVRAKWSGITGGDEVHQAVEDFFDGIEQRSQ